MSALPFSESFFLLFQLKEQAVNNLCKRIPQKCSTKLKRAEQWGILKPQFDASYKKYLAY